MATIPAEIHLNDIGVQFLVTMKDQDGDIITDLNLLADKKFIFVKPDLTKLTKNAIFVTDGTDGLLYYTSLTGDLDQSGTWNFQVVVTYSNGKTYSSDIERFIVHRNLL